MKQSLLITLIFSSIVIAAQTSHDHFKEIAKEYCYLADYMQRAGQDVKAKEYYEKALSLDSKNSAANAHLGTLFFKQHNTDLAIEHLAIVAQQEPENIEAQFNLGLCYIKKEEWKAAFNHLQRVISLNPHHENALIAMGSVCEKIQQFDEAIKAYTAAIQINNQSVEAHHHLGNLYRHLEQLENAITPYKKAHQLDPSNIHILMDLANALNMLHRNEESLEMYQKIIEQNPNAISALYNFGFTLKKMGKLERALEIYQQVLSKKPDYAPVHFSLSSIYLTLGDLENGWKEYEWRWKAYNQKPEKYNRPLWQGEDLNGKTLLVYAEQGLGDTLQFIRYLKVLKHQYPYARINFESQDPLVTLLKGQPYIDELTSRSERPTFCHYHIPLMSIPGIMQTRLNTIPAEVPYIEPPAELVSLWKEKMSHDRNFKIGLCWQGNAGYSTQSLRRAVALKSIHLKEFAPLFELPNVSVYCLQKIHGLEQIAECSFKDKLITFDDSFDNHAGRFMDTAAVMKNLDLVISVDTGTCHLAAAMNVPTFIVLPFPADWRWLLNRNDSPWYPSVQLFRQEKPLEWQPTIQVIINQVNALLNKYDDTKAAPTQMPTHYHDKATPEQQLFFDELIKTLE